MEPNRKYPSMTSIPLLSFIIPTLHFKRPINPKKFYKPRSNLLDLLGDIESNVQIDSETIVILNSQSSRYIDILKSDARIDKLVLNSVNPGVSRSWNIGIAMAEGTYLCFVNDDVRIGRNSIEELLKVLEDEPDVAIVGPRGDLYRNGKHLRYVGAEVPEYCDVVSGFMFIVRENIVKSLGGFDTRFTPAGYEEVDLCFSINNIGRKCKVVPHLDIKHNGHHGVSSFKTKIEYFDKTIDTLSLHKSNTEYFQKKWLSGD